MASILSITAPIFILIALGYFCVRTRLVSQETTRGMGIFVITIALPAMIVRGMANKPLDASFDVDFLAGYAIASLILFSGGLLAWHHLHKRPLTESSVAALGMSASNSGFVGVSICTLVLGQEIASRVVAMTITVESMMIMPIAMAIADMGMGGNGMNLPQRILQTLKRLVRSPLLIAIAAGLFLAATGIRLPAVATRVIDMLAMAAAPVALFAVGGNLYGLRPSSALLAKSGAISAAKLVVHPVLTALVLAMFSSLDPMLGKAGLIFAASPMLSIFPVLGMRYGLEDRCSTALLLCTATSFVTVSTTIALIS